VHCGFCLQACPTYLTLDDENDSPRGRLLIMRELLAGTIAPDDPTAQIHIDRCLGCRACETACPSGVPYGHLLEATRATLAQHGNRSVLGGAILFVFARPRLLALALGSARLLRATGIPALLQRIPGRLGFAMGMLASSRDALGTAPYSVRQPATRGTVAILEGCVMRHLFAHTNRATGRTLAVNGYEVRESPGQRCCGALHAHGGDLDGARALARANIDAFERAGAELIAVNAAGCGAMMKEYGSLLADDPEWAGRARALSARVRDVSELLAAAGPAPGGPVGARVAYDAPCHLLHAQRVVSPPLAVLGAVGGAEVVALRDADQCCGGAGIYTLVEPETSAAVLDRKIERIREAFERNTAERGDRRPCAVATGNPGCLMQIGAGLRAAGVPVRVVHPVDLLDAAYAVDRK
jgi:glycolate oxidase iron-sulfur subunit